MDLMEFFRDMKAHCLSMNAECVKCCMRLYCYTPPCELTDSMVEKVTSFLGEHNHTEGHNHSDHHSEVVQMPCLSGMDMSTALGSELR